MLSNVGGFRKAKMYVKSLAKKSGHTCCRLSHIFGLQFGLIEAKYSEIYNHRFVSDNKAVHVLTVPVIWRGFCAVKGKNHEKQSS